MHTAIELQAQLPVVEQYVDEAVSDPHGWVRVLDFISGTIGASSASLAIRRSDTMEMLEPVAATWEADVSREYLDHFVQQDVMPSRMAAIPRRTVTLLQELIDMRDFSRTEIYNDWAKKNDLAFFAGITFDLDERQVAVMSFHRSLQTPEFDPQERKFLERVTVPIRFALRHRKLTQELAAAHGALGRVQTGVILLDERGGVLHCNERAEEILTRNDGLTLVRNRLRASNPGANKELRAMIDRVLEGEVGRRGDEMFIPRKGYALPLHVVAVPLSMRMRESLWQDYVPTAVFINDMAQDDSLVDLESMFCRLFGCTQLQAELARHVANGARNKDLVNEQRNAETIKSHIKAIFNKTGVDGRAGLSKLAQRLVMPLRAGISRA